MGVPGLDPAPGQSSRCIGWLPWNCSRHLFRCTDWGSRPHLGEPSNFRWPLVRGEPASGPDLFLQPTGSPTQYEVIADAQIVSRITLSNSLRHHNKPWVWSINLAFSDGHDPVSCFRGHTRRGDAGVRTQLVQRAPLSHRRGILRRGLADDRAGEANGAPTREHWVFLGVPPTLCAGLLKNSYCRAA